MPLFILTEETAQPRHREDAICSWEEDEGLLKYINKNKGRKLIARMLPLLPSYYAHAIFLFFMRNFCLILGILDQSPDFSSKALLPAMKNVISNLFNIPQIIMCLQVLICFHKDDALYYILRTIVLLSFLHPPSTFFFTSLFLRFFFELFFLTVLGWGMAWIGRSVIVTDYVFTSD